MAQHLKLFLFIFLTTIVSRTYGVESSVSVTDCQSCQTDCLQKYGQNNPGCETACSMHCKEDPSLPPPTTSSSPFLSSSPSPTLPDPSLSQATIPSSTNISIPPPLGSTFSSSPLTPSTTLSTNDGACPPNWQNRGGLCFDPTGSPCNGKNFSNLSSDDKNALAIYCGINNWADTTPCPDGWSFDSTTGQCRAPGLLPCSPTTFYGNVSYKSLSQLQEWAKNCAAPWVGINYTKGQNPPVLSSPQCPDGWSAQTDGSCKLIATSPQTSCSTGSGVTNWSTQTPDEKWQWASQCGWPWAYYGLPFPCPVGFNKVTGSNSSNSCVRQDAVPEGVNMSSKYYHITNGCKQLDINGWDRSAVKQLAQDCKLNWPGINMPDPRYPNQPLN